MATVVTVPYESSLTVKPQLVGWCPVSETFDPTYDGPGATCYMCEGDEGGKRHRVQKRRMYVCPVCGCGYLSRAGLLDHHHDECC